MNFKFNKYFMFAVICAFAAAYFFFSINGWFYDKHHLNWLLIVLGSASVLGIFYFLRKI